MRGFISFGNKQGDRPTELSTVRRLLRRLLGNEKASVAVEYSLVLLPFIALILANLETALMMFTNSVIQGGIVSAARLVRTGQVASSTTGSGACPSAGTAATIPTTFSNAVCNNIFGQFTCSNLNYDVRSFSSFSNANTTFTMTYSNGSPTNNCFDTGGSSGIVAVRVIYKYTFITPGLANIIGSSGNNTVSFLYTVIQQNEPF